MRYRFPYLLIPLMWSPAWADQASSPLDREIRAHFQEMMGRVNDPARNLAERQRLVLEAVATLDRAAQAFKDPEDRREIWFQAARTLDTFNRQNPHHDRLADLSLQAATYEWAASFSLSEQALLTPTDARLRERAIRELEAVAQRFRDVIKSSPTEVQRQTARYRLAVVLSDRGRLEIQDDAARRKWESEALELVAGRFEPAALDYYARILRAELLNRLDRPGEALDVIDPGDERFGQPAALRIRAESLAAVGRSEEALDLLTSPPFEPAARAAAIASVRLIQVKRAPVGSSRSLAEEDLFRQARSLQGPEARRVRLALARTLVEPGPDRLPED